MSKDIEVYLSDIYPSSATLGESLFIGVTASLGRITYLPHENI